jgi:hypothetical protein
VATTKGSVLRVIKETVVTQFRPNVKAIYDITLSFLEESYGSLITDTIASLKKTRDIPPHLKEKGKAASKKSGSKHSKRRAK